MALKSLTRISFALPIFCFFAAIPLFTQGYELHPDKAGTKVGYNRIFEQRFVSSFILAEPGYVEVDHISKLPRVIVPQTQKSGVESKARPNDKALPTQWWKGDGAWYKRNEWPPKSNLSLAYLFSAEELYVSNSLLPSSTSYQVVSDKPSYRHLQVFESGKGAWLYGSDGDAGLSSVLARPAYYYGQDIQGGGCEICILILSIFVLSVFSSSLLGIYLTAIALHSLGDSFTVAAYVLAVGAFAWSALMAWHTPRCKLRSTMNGPARSQVQAREGGRPVGSLGVEDIQLESQTVEGSAQTS